MKAFAASKQLSICGQLPCGGTRDVCSFEYSSKAAHEPQAF